MTDKCIILTTTGDKQEAEDISWALVERKLAACVNILPMESVFRWKGEVDKSSEFLLLVKTNAANFARVAALVKEMNSYDLPECISVPVDAGTENYISWVTKSVE